MGIIYFLTTYMGTMSRGIYETSENGAIALSQISNHYFGNLGIYFLLIVVTLACFKTSIALIVSCSEIFHKMFPNVLSEKKWTVIFTVFSFIVSNFGLNAIITYAIPFLMFIYPLAISLILLSLFGKLFNYNKNVFVFTTIFTFIASTLEFIVAFPKNSIIPTSFIDKVASIQSYLPFADIGLSWVIPAVVGLIVGLIVAKVKK